uniref:Chemokine interleukin-8-like domain-containing protein n=1 Tax=Kryptolebias marmoratus TaxID=37003 RepID=A0A3Q3FA39_KRYMA
MKFSLIVATLFCFTAWMNLIQAFTAPVQNCRCVGLSKTKVPYSQMKSDTIQEEGVCPVRAVITGSDGHGRLTEKLLSRGQVNTELYSV